MYLHEAATTGLGGAAMMLVALALCLRRLWTTPAGHPYADGTLLVLGGWLIGALFDCYQLSGTMFGLFGFVAGFCL